MSYCATEGLIGSLKAPDALDNETGVRLISLFDNEEIGSRTAQVNAHRSRDDEIFHVIRAYQNTPMY